MVESRLLHSEMRISEIVEELGFTDESHLNRLFKKYKDCNPTDLGRSIGGNKFLECISTDYSSLYVLNTTYKQYINFKLKSNINLRI